MANKSSAGLVLLVVVVGLVGLGYLKSQQGSSTAPPAPPGSDTGRGTGKYVALGDSYTSSPRTGSQAGDPPGCDRTTNNYPHLVAADLKPASFTDVSCSGATTASG